MDQTQPTPADTGRPAHLVLGTLPQALDRAANTTAALHFHSGRGALTETLTYASLRTEAIDLAGRLLATGLRPGDRVAIIAETNADFPRIFFACQYACLVPVPMPLPAPFGGRTAYLAHIGRMIEGAAAAAAFAPPDLRDWLLEAASGSNLAFCGTLAELPRIREAVSDLPTAGTDDLCYLQFSSGSTRFPIGVAVTQAALMANADAIIRHGLQVRAGDRCVSWLPFYHDMGLVGFMLAPLVAELSVDYLATRDFARRPMLWLELIERNGGTISYSPSFGYDLCARRAATMSAGTLDLSRWRIAGIGGDMVRPHVLAAFAARFSGAGFGPERFVASYGMAEAALALSFAPLGHGLQAQSVDRHRLEHEDVAAPAGDPVEARDFVLCGPALPGHRLEVRDPSGAVLPQQRVGRIFAKGPSLMREYFRDPEATAAVLSSDGWLDTGDLGYLVGDQIVITGRAKDLIIINGRNIWPQDLEWTAEAEVEGLRSGDVALFSSDDGEEEHVVALVECRVTDPGARVTIAESVEKVLRSRHGVEAKAVLVKPHTLPVTSSGKLSRTGARELYRAMRLEGAAAARS